MALSLGFSPCPNDTFVFHALVHGLVEGPEVDVTYADIDVLNAHALAGDLDVVKVSYAVLPRLRGYTLLPSGGALGRGCGPLVVTKGRDDVRGATIAVPGEHTTAYLLLRLWDPGFADVTVMPFDRIMPAVAAGEVDAGLVIHESRFTYPSYGLTAVADLGDWWEGETGLPIPLGAIVARDSLDTAAIAEAIRRSVEHAWAHPEDSRDYVLAHSQELAPDVVDAHIALYVNELTRDLGTEGRRAADELLARAAARGLVRA
ncbi:MAG TPA: 1,4-dihydroxy-6-naphthoate synthase [Frankiaceae bacterium]|jgi:1,4-dihydroxy-6-naphthoate synthase|nr:1,4-dihydroxy-6-naphthoate synthase [Frankiaceae bacterium]